MALNKDTERELAKVAKRRNAARESERSAWRDLTGLMKTAHEQEGATFGEIGKVVGITKGRVYQIVTGNRGGKPPAKNGKAPAKKTLKKA